MDRLADRRFALPRAGGRVARERFKDSYYVVETRQVTILMIIGLPPPTVRYGDVAFGGIRVVRDLGVVIEYTPVSRVYSTTYYFIL